MKYIKGASGFIRKILADRIEVRHIPKLEFIYDESIEYGRRIEDKIKEIHEKEKPC
jgi:ribosome-binding factor A